MKLYCGKCKQTYKRKELNKTYSNEIESECYICPSCKNDNLKVIVTDTEIGLAWNKKSKEIHYIEYDKNNFDIYRSQECDLYDIDAMLSKMMEALNLDALEMEDITLVKKTLTEYLNEK